MEPSFEKCLVHLIDDGVEFVLVGGLAVSLNGYVRLTEDIDILVSQTEDNLLRLIESLGKFGEGFGGELSLDDLGPEPGAIRIIEDTEQVQIDIFSQIGGLSFQDVEENSESGEVTGRSFRYASKSQLIRIKSGSVREKDQLDVSALTKLIEDPEVFD